MKRNVIIFAICLILLALWLWPSGDYKIDAVLDGNIVQLNNGTKVRLIGVSSTEEGKQYLFENYQTHKVTLIPDRSAAFNPNNLKGNEVVYSYLYNKDGDLCINEAMLKEGVADLEESVYLIDKLKAFKKAAQTGKSVSPNPKTPTKPRAINYNKDDIDLPAYIMPDERRHSTWYKDGNMNIDMLEEACDYDLPYTKSFANQLAARSQGNFNPGQICEIFKYCYNNWRYVNDPSGHEYLARASETIASYLTGDCDDFAILMASCILAVGGDACINTGHNLTGGHAFTEVDISRFDKDAVLGIIREHFPQYEIPVLHTRKEGNHEWLNLDWQCAYPGGSYYDCSLSRDAYPNVHGHWSWNKIK